MFELKGGCVSRTAAWTVAVHKNLEDSAGRGEKASRPESPMYNENCPICTEVKIPVRSRNRYRANIERSGDFPRDAAFSSVSVGLITSASACQVFQYE
jgi:hypothetical protein